MKIITKSEKETIELGKKIACGLQSGKIIGLEGELGAGKTTLIKGIARGLGVKKSITSPTFVLMKVYKIADLRGWQADKGGYKIKRFVHVDAYRIRNEKDLVLIGIEEYLGDKKTVVVIEWADKVKKLLRGRGVIWIKMRLGRKENEREVIIKKYKV